MELARAKAQLDALQRQLAAVTQERDDLLAKLAQVCDCGCVVSLLVSVTACAVCVFIWKCLLKVYKSVLLLCYFLVCTCRHID